MGGRVRVRSVRRGPAVVAVALGVLIAGCTAGADPDTAEPEPDPVTAIQVCGGSLLTADAGKALERVLESAHFVIRDGRENTGVPAIGKALEDAYRSGTRILDAPRPGCDMSGEPKEFDGSSYYPSAQLRFRPYSTNAKLPDYVPGVNDDGISVTAGYRSRAVSFDCVSTRVGSTQEVPLRITADFANKWDKGGAGSPETAREQDYLVIAHAAALAVAEELGCANDGGLPARADGLPKPAA